MTSALAKAGDIAKVSDVGFLKALRRSKEWLRWLAAGVMQKWFPVKEVPVSDSPLRVRIIDGSTVQEPGSKGTSWKLHYSLELPSLRCDEVIVTGPETGESFCQFTVNRGDLLMGDRGLAQRRGIHYVVQSGGDVLVRVGVKSMVFLDPSGERFDLLGHLRTLKHHHIGDWQVGIPYGNDLIIGRICAVRKSETAARKAREKIERENRKKGRKTRPETLEAAGYIMMFTTLDKSISEGMILQIYRIRWQVELAFKRLKSILGIGNLHSVDGESCKAWLYGKLLIAFLVEALTVAASAFSPWGYRIRPSTRFDSLTLEGNPAHAAFPDASGEPD
jgi:hypothetical protein